MTTMASQSVVVTLELRSGDGPIRGHIEHPSGTRWAFHGWLELSQALDDVRLGRTPTESASVRIDNWGATG